MNLDSNKLNLTPNQKNQKKKKVEEVEFVILNEYI